MSKSSTQPSRSQGADKDAAADAFWLYGLMRACDVPGLAGDTQPVLPGAAVIPVTLGDVAAIVSPVPPGLFADGDPACRMDEPDWLAARAIAHDGMQTAMLRAGPVIPVRFGALFAHEEALRTAISAPDAVLVRLDALEGRAEWNLRVHLQRDALVADCLAGAPELETLRTRLAAAGPGQAFLLQKRMARAAEDVADHHLSGIASALRSGLEAFVEDLSFINGGRGDAVFRLACLVRCDGEQAFRAAAEKLGENLAAGISLSVGGPYAPASFANIEGQALT